MSQVCVTNADFLFADEEMSVVTGDEEGIIRIYEYNPQGQPSVALLLPALIQ
jgi:cleavage and polyadenylation specificity factor subunit 1